MYEEIYLCINTNLCRICCYIDLWYYLSKHVGTFSISNYSRELTEFSSQIELGKIQNSDKAKSAAEKIWTETFGASVKGKRPYRVSFDEEKHVWLVRGSYLLIPGGPHILIQKKDGKVLAVWHDKF